MIVCKECGHTRTEHWESGCMACRCLVTDAELWKQGVREGEELRDQGMARVENADVGGEWRDAAYAWIQRQSTGQRFTSIDLVESVGMPPKVNSVGACMNGAGRLGWIANTREYVKSPRKLRHAAVVAVWVRI